MPETAGRILFFLMLLFYSMISSGNEPLPETLDIRIFSSQKITSLQVTTVEGSYSLWDQDGVNLRRIRAYDRITFRSMGTHTEIEINASKFYVAGAVFLRGEKLGNFFLIRPEGYKGRYRTYDDDLVIDNRNGELILINRLAFEKYVAGVVQSESGWFRHPEFYKVQASIARTYALRSMGKHSSEGFHLCDQVHCQAYHGRCDYPEIISGVWLSMGDVVADGHNRLIESVYHANCGGQTVNSEDLWPQEVSYLRSVIDPYCSGKPGSSWQHSIPLSEYYGYLNKNYLHLFPGEGFSFPSNFSQSTRLHHLDDTGIIHLRHLRSQFRLRSTFFSFSSADGLLNIQGRGYGHGVGLCQEGAMQMADQGFSADSIIKFYYQGVKVISLYNMFPDNSNW